MTGSSQRCKATTQKGAQCRNYAIIGSEFCHMHGGRASSAPVSDAQPVDAARSGDSKGPIWSPARPALSRPFRMQPDRDLLFQELDGLMRELGARLPEVELHNVTPATLVRLFNQVLGQRLPQAQSSLMADLERNLQDADFTDLIDAETLRGMALLTYYSWQAQTATVRGPVIDRIKGLPGAAMLLELRDNLSGTTIHDLVDPDTWKGLWYIVSYTAQTKLQELRERDTSS